MAYYTGDALMELRGIKSKPDGHLDMESLPSFARRERRQNDDVVYERDLGAMISMLTVAVQQLLERVEKLESK